MSCSSVLSKFLFLVFDILSVLSINRSGLEILSASRRRLFIDQKFLQYISMLIIYKSTYEVKRRKQDVKEISRIIRLLHPLQEGHLAPRTCLGVSL